MLKKPGIYGDGVSCYIQGLLDGAKPKHTAYAVDCESRQTSLAHFLGKTKPHDRESDRQGGHQAHS